MVDEGSVGWELGELVVQFIHVVGSVNQAK